MPARRMIVSSTARTVAAEGFKMTGTLGRILLGMAVGSLVLIAMVIAYAMDVADRDDGIREVF